jgi:hypothetical protein
LSRGWTGMVKNPRFICLLLPGAGLTGANPRAVDAIMTNPKPESSEIIVR